METYQLLQQAYGEDVRDRTQVFDWFCQFKESKTPLKATPTRDNRQHQETRK